MISLLKDVSGAHLRGGTYTHTPIDDDPGPGRVVTINKIAREKVAKVDRDTSELGRLVLLRCGDSAGRLTKVRFKTRRGMIGYAA